MSNRITIDEAIAKLRVGGVVAVPTETVYGLAGVATFPETIKHIYAIKNRPADNPLVCHFDGMAMIERYTQPIEPHVQYLIQELTPGPVSFLLPLNGNNGQLLLAATCGRSAVVCRIPEHWLTLSIIKQLDVPLAAPSANTSGRISPTTGQMVLDDIGNKIDGAVDGGPCIVGIESTILDCRVAGQISIIRPGAIGIEVLHPMLSRSFAGVQLIYPEFTAETIPGYKYKHYAPKTAVIPVTLEEAQKIDFNSSDLIIGVEEDVAPLKDRVPTIDLGQRANPAEIAHNLYINLQQIDDRMPVRAFYIIHTWGSTDIEQAIANRVSKAFGLLT